MPRSLAVLLSLTLAAPMFGCSCRQLTECEIVQQPVLFIGQVISGGVPSLRDDPWQYPNPKPVRFKVVELFRGLPKDTHFVDIEVGPTYGMCSPNPYVPGQTYLVMPSVISGKLLDGGCFSGRNIRDAADTVQYVRDYFAGKLPLNIHGQVAVADATIRNFVGYLLSTGAAKPESGVKVSTLKDGKTYSSTTDADGRYRLTVPSRGNYEVKAELSPYESDVATVTVADGGCVVHDFALQSNSTISGRLLNAKGQAVRDASVALIDLSQPDGNRLLKASDLTNGRGFVFTHVPIGKYLLVSNPDGPRRPGLRVAIGSLPFEPTYYPNGTSRLNAQIIEVTGANVHLTGKNLTMGKLADFRSVVVNVRFPDGAPMRTALVSVIGEPIEQGGLPWNFSEAAEGVVRFHAPANRNLRISITDWYGRELKMKYESTHKAGTTPVNQEFVIEP